MTEFKIGVVDVYLIAPRAAGWRVLALRRAEGTRCTGAWETVHGRIEDGERPEDAAVREVGEETGLAINRLYNVTCQPFYLHRFGHVQLAVVFAAFVDDAAEVQTSPEHDQAEWLSVEDVLERFVWPRSRTAFNEILALLGSGDAGPVEDVLRVF